MRGLAVLVALGAGALVCGCVGNSQPVASLQVTPAVAAVGQPVHLDGSRSWDPDGRVVAYRFIVSDGSRSVPTTVPRIDHTFQAPGEYQVTLVVEDDHGARDRADSLVRVGSPGPRPDAGLVDATPPDSLPEDSASVPLDADHADQADAVLSDASVLDAAPADARPPDDAPMEPPLPDAVAPDAALPDAVEPDAPLPDAGWTDPWSPNAPLPDAVWTDPWPPDAPLPDAEWTNPWPTDAPLPDAEQTDPWPPDAPLPDAGWADPEPPDASPPDGPAGFVVEVVLSGDGDGLVTSSPPGISCPGECQSRFDEGTTVTLSAMPADDSTFRGWSADCAGLGECTLTVAQPRAVVAWFEGRRNTVFATSSLQTGALGGLAGADAICAARASEAGLPGTFVAWLSTTSVDARDRLAGARGWLRPDGRPFADRVEDLAAGRLFYPPRIDERGQDIVADPWASRLTGTGTWGHGTLWTAAEQCNDWTSTDGQFTGGSVSSVSLYWSQGNIAGCSFTFRLICFSIDQDRAVSVVPPADARLAFQSFGTMHPGGGLQAADAICQAEASAAGFGGSFLALLASDGASAASRFSADGPPWARLDGVPLTGTAADLLDGGPLDTGLNLCSDMSYWGGLVWTGAPSVELAPTSNCDDWTTTTSGAGKYGSSTSSDTYWFGGFERPCSDGYRLYCLEE